MELVEYEEFEEPDYAADLELDLWDEETVEIPEVLNWISGYTYYRCSERRAVDSDSVRLEVTSSDPFDFVREVPQIFLTLQFEGSSTVSHRLTTWLLLAHRADLDYTVEDRRIELPIRWSRSKRSWRIREIRVQIDSSLNLESNPVIRFRSNRSATCSIGTGSMIRGLNYTDTALLRARQLHFFKTHTGMMLAIGGTGVKRIWDGTDYQLEYADSNDLPPTLEAVHLTVKNESFEFPVDEMRIITLRDLTIYSFDYPDEMFELLGTKHMIDIIYKPFWSFEPSSDMRVYLTMLVDG